MSASSEARISSGLTFGWVEASGMVASPPRRSRPRVPGSTSITMSLRPVFGRSSSEASSLIRGAYLFSTSIVDHGVAVLELDARDVADLDPGDVHGLALARRHRLGRGELRLELEAVLAEERHPARQRGPPGSTRITPAVKRPATIRAMIAMKSRRCSRIARFMARGSAGRLAAAGPVEVGDGVDRSRGRRCGRAAWCPSRAGSRSAPATARPYWASFVEAPAGDARLHERQRPAAGLVAGGRARCRRSSASRRRSW